MASGYHIEQCRKATAVIQARDDSCSDHTLTMRMERNKDLKEIYQTKF